MTKIELISPFLSLFLEIQNCFYICMEKETPANVQFVFVRFEHRDVQLLVPRAAVDVVDVRDADKRHDVDAPSSA